MHLVAVVIPIYKNTFSKNEQIALKQCLTVLKNYSIIIIKPKSLELKGDWTNAISKMENFEDRYFQNIRGYNDLMMATELYQRFTTYKYILICQLDVFIFRDELSYWCEQGFDYIGAPWIREVEPTILTKIKQKIALWLKLKHPNGVAYRDIVRDYVVGNGGFSLRNTNKFLELLPKFQKEVAYYSQNNDFRLNEDVFWSVEVNRYRKNLRIPDYQTALDFAFELYPSLAYQINKQKLPFGCHAFDVYEPDFWKQFINF